MKSLLIPFRCIGLGLVVGAILHTSARAQDPPPPVRSDSAQQDSIRARQIADSIARADTLRPATPTFPAPSTLDEEFTWTGDSILASGALSLAELIGRVPGAAAFRAGSPVTPSAPAYGGCFRCVRIFLDGIEMAAADPRSGGILDHAEIPLWILEEVRIVRGAGELRVYLTTWGVVKTIPYTRLDILTGSDETSLFGGLFGRRYKRGETFQVGAQQFATTSRLNSGAGDRGTLFLRLGVTKERFSIDATVNRVTRSREEQEQSEALSPLPAFEGSRTDAYLRLTLGRPSSGPWLQIVAASMNVKEETPGTGPPPPGEGEPPGPSADTSRTEAQYVISAGSTLGAIRATASARFRSLEGARSNEFSLFAHAPLGPHRIDINVGRDTRDSTMVAEVGLLARPLSFLRLTGIAGQRTSFGGSTATEGIFASGDLGVRINRLWLHGGVILRDSITIEPPTVFDASLSERADPAATGTYVKLRGSLWRDLFADVSVAQWDRDGWYRPASETSATIYVDTWWLNKFPQRTFHVYAGLTWSNRGDVRFPSGDAGEVVARGHSTISSLLEIRILSAVISWQARNIRGLEQSEVPGLQLPRRLNVYGVRWVLWN